MGFKMTTDTSSPKVIHLFSHTKHQLWAIGIGTFVLFITSQLSIPFQPVPLTFQSTTVILLGLALGSRMACATVVTYLLAGTLGLPVFANFSGGIANLIGPTGGYLLGFLPAAYISGLCADKGFGRQPLSCFAVALPATGVMFLLGATLLAYYVGTQQAWILGVKPFILTEFIKLIVACLIAPRFWRPSI